MKIPERLKRITNKVIAIPGHLWNFRSFFSIGFFAISQMCVAKVVTRPTGNCNNGYKRAFYFAAFYFKLNTGLTSHFSIFVYQINQSHT